MIEINVKVAFQVMFHTTSMVPNVDIPRTTVNRAPNKAEYPIGKFLGFTMTKNSVIIKITIEIIKYVRFCT